MNPSRIPTATHNLTGKPILRPERRLSFVPHTSIGTVTIHECETLPGLREGPPLAAHTARFDVLVPEGLTARLTITPEFRLYRAFRPMLDWAPHALDELSLIGCPGGGGILRHFDGQIGLRFLDLCGTGATDAVGPTLASLTGLEWLSLSDTEVGTPGVACLDGLEDLIRLSLRGTAITDGVLGIVAALPNLTWLSLADTAVTATGLAWLLAHAPALRLLAINGTAAAEDPRTAALERHPELEFFVH